MTNTQTFLFFDQRRPGVPVPESQIKREYAQAIVEGSVDPAETSFNRYLGNRMEKAGGTLSMRRVCWIVTLSATGWLTAFFTESAANVFMAQARERGIVATKTRALLDDPLALDWCKEA